MPSNYAHYRFGCLGLEKLTVAQKRSVQRFRQLYDVGQHGPDPFYYHNPFRSNRVEEIAARAHRQTGKEFFAHACAAYREAPSEAARVYLYGLLGHYCLDSSCHPYVWQLHKAGTVRHAELETDFERFLLRLDGIFPPHQHNTGSHLRLTRGECVTAARFFPEATAGQIRTGVRNMALYSALLSHKNRRLLNSVLKHASQNVRDHVMQTAPNPRCESANRELLERFTQALDRYGAMAAQLDDYLEKGIGLGPEFDGIFG